MMLSKKLHLSRRVQHAATGLVLLGVSYAIPPYPAGFVLLTLATAAFYAVHSRRLRDVEWDAWYLDRFGGLLREHERGEWERCDGEGSGEGSDGKRKNGGASAQERRRNGTIDNGGAASAMRMRRKTPPSIPGAFYFLLGTAMSTALFPSAVARASLLVLSLADPMAGLVGVWFSEYVGWNITWRRFFWGVCGGVGSSSSSSSKGDGKKSDGGPSVAGSVACAATSVLCTYCYIPSSSATEATVVSLSFSSRIWIGVVTALTEAAAGGGSLPDDNLLIPLVVGSSILWLHGIR